MIYMKDMKDMIITKRGQGYYIDKEVFTDEKWMEFIAFQIINNSIKYINESHEISFYAMEKHCPRASDCIREHISGKTQKKIFHIYNNQTG